MKKMIDKFYTEKFKGIINLSGEGEGKASITPVINIGKKRRKS